MTTYIIDGTKIKSEKDLHSFFFNTFDIPYYGRNLDALNDVLTGMLEGPLRFIWTDTQTSRSNMGERFDFIVSFLKRVESKEADLVFEFI